MKRVIIILILAAVSLAACSEEPEASGKNKIKVFSYWLIPTVNPMEMRSLSFFDGVILSHGNLWNNPTTIMGIKTNKYIYVNPWEIHDPPYPDQRLDKMVYTETMIRRPEYFLNTTKKGPIVFWPGMRVLNLSTNCPFVDGKRCWEYLADLYINEIIYHPAFVEMAGLYIDNPTRTVDWLKGHNGKNLTIDSDNDGQDDDRYLLNEAWSAGMCAFLEKIKATMGSKKLIGNTADLEMVQYFDLIFLENFPEQQGGLENAIAILQTKPAIIHVEAKDSELGAACAMLYDCYLAVGQQGKYQAAFDLDLGRPKGPATREGDIVTRYYKGGKISLDIQTKKTEISRK